MKLLEQTEIHMGGRFILKAYPPTNMLESKVHEAFECAFAEVARVENLLTDFRESPFNKINEMAGIESVKVEEEIFNLIKRSISVSKDSLGVFDISYASVGNLWREAKLNGKTPHEGELQRAKKLINYKRIILNEKDSSVFLPKKGMKIGLGGIGKGYAVDCAFKILIDAGIENFYVNGSGDIRVHSAKDAKRPWKIAIRNPMSADENKMMGHLQISHGAIATSGDYVNYIKLKNKKVHHVFNPSTGESSEDVISATVFSNEAIVSDTSATIVMIKGKTEGINYLNKNELLGFLVTGDGKVFHSQKSAKGLQSLQDSL